MAQTIVGRVTTIIDADNTKLLASIKESKSAINKLADKLSSTPLSVKLSLDSKQFKKELDKITSTPIKAVKVKLQVEKGSGLTEREKSFKKLFEGFKPTDKPKMPIAKATESLKDQKSLISDLNKIKSKTVSLNANDHISAKATKIVTALEAIKSKKIKLEVETDTGLTKKENSFKQLFEGFKEKEKPKMPIGKALTPNIKEAKKEIGGLPKSIKIKLELDAKGFFREFSKVKKSLNTIRNKSINFNAKKASSRLKHLNGGLTGLARTGRDVNFSLKNLFTGISFAAVGAGITKMTQAIIKLGVEAERTEIGFQSLLDSQVKGSQLFQGIIDLAKVTPFTSRQLNSAARTLLAYGIAGEKVLPVLRQIGDVSSGTGADIKKVALAYGQVMAMGKLMGQELIQLTNAGFNPLQEISKKTGKSVGKLKEEMRKGLVTSKMVEEAFESATGKGGLFFEMMEKQSKTVGGRWSTFVDTVEQTARNIFKIVDKPVRNVVEGLNEAADRIEKLTRGEININVEGMGGGMGLAGKTAIASTAVIGGFSIIGALGLLGTALFNFFKSTKGIILEALKAINIATKISIGKGAAKKVTDIGKFQKALKKAGDITVVTKPEEITKVEKLKRVIDSLIKAGGRGAGILARVTAGIAKLAKGVLAFVSLISKVIRAVAAIAAGIGGLIVAAIAGALFLINDFNKGDANLLEAFVFSIKGLFNLLKKAISPLGSVIKFLGSAIKFIKKGAKTFLDAMGTVYIGIKKFFTGIGTIYAGMKFAITGLLKPVINLIDFFTQPLQDLGSSISEKLGLDVLVESLVGAEGVFKDFNSTVLELSRNFANFISFGWFGKLSDDLNSLPMKDGVIDFGIEDVRVEQLRAKIKDRGKITARTINESEKARKEAKELNKLIEDGLNKYVDAAFSEINLQMDIQDARANLEKTLSKNRENAEQAIIEFQKMVVEAAEKIPESIAAGTEGLKADEIPEALKNIDFSEFLGGDMSTQEILDQIPEAKLPAFTDILNKILGKPIKKLEEGFADISTEINISDAIDKIKNSELGEKISEEFKNAFQKVKEKAGDKGIFKGINSIEEALFKLPKEVIPGFLSLLEKEIDSANNKINRPIDQFEKGFADISTELDLFDAIDKIQTQGLRFNKLFEKFAGKGIFKGINSIEEALFKLPEEVIPGFLSLLEKEIDSADNKITNLFDRFELGRDIDFAKEDIKKNKIFFEPLLAEFGFDSFEQAFLQIPDKLLPEFRDVLSNAAPDFSARLGQINRNMDIFESRMRIRERFREDNLGDLVNIPVDKIERTLREAFSKSPLEDRPEILAQIERFFPKIDRDENVGKAAPGGAFLGSVEANRILTGRQEEKTDKKIEENTKLANEYLKQISEGGINLRNVAVAR